MVLSEKGHRYVFIMTISLLCLCFPSAGFAEKGNSEFYAGPLSAVAETVVKVKVPQAAAPSENFQQAEEKALPTDFEKSGEAGSPEEKYSPEPGEESGAEPAVEGRGKGEKLRGDDGR